MFGKREYRIVMVGLDGMDMCFSHVLLYLVGSCWKNLYSVQTEIEREYSHNSDDRLKLDD
jgi:hypothetical protein